MYEEQRRRPGCINVVHSASVLQYVSSQQNQISDIIRHTYIYVCTHSLYCKDTVSYSADSETRDPIKDKHVFSSKVRRRAINKMVTIDQLYSTAIAFV